MTPVTQTTHPSELWQGFWGIQVLHAGQSLGLFETLLAEKSPSTLAQERGLEVRYAESWCQAASHFGLLLQNEDRFQTPPQHADWLERSKGYTHTHLHLVKRANETLDAVFGGRALPEPQISLRLLLQESLQANYQWLFQEITTASPNLEARLRVEGRALEIGCGVGFGLSFLRDFYPNLELFGLEADYECALEAERTTRAVIHVGEFPRARFAQGFDLILCFRSLTASRDPRALLLECARLLNKDGFFLLGSETSDENRARKSQARLHGERFAYNILAGESLVNSFTKLELHTLLDDCGLEIELEMDAPDWATPAFLCRLKA